MVYNRFRSAWKNRPDTSTPITAEALDHFEEGVKAAHDALDGRLSDATLNATYGRFFPITANQLNATPSVSGLINSVAETAAASSDGSPIVLLPPGEWTLDISGWDEVGDGHCLTIPYGVELRGAGRDVTVLVVDPTETIPAGHDLVSILVGRRDVGGRGVRVTHLTLNQEQIHLTTGETVLGVASHQSTAALLDPIHDVELEDARIIGGSQGFCCHKNGNATQAQTAARLAAQHTGWWTRRTVFEKQTNKCVEYNEAHDSGGDDLTLIDVSDGPQAIFSSHHIYWNRVRGTYLDSGFNITEGSHDVYITDPGVYASPNADPATASRGALAIRTEPQATTSVQGGVYVRGGFLRDTVKLNRRVVGFQTRAESLGATYRGVFIDGTLLDGDVWLHDPLSPAKTTIEQVKLRDAKVTGALRTVARSTCKLDDLDVHYCDFVAPQSILGTGFDLEGNKWRGGLTLAASSNKVISYRDRTDTGTVTNSGVDNVVTGERALGFGDPFTPASLSGLVAAFDADGLPAGTFTSWAPVAGIESAALTAVGTNPITVADASIGGHRTVDLLAASSHRLTTGAWGTTIPNAAFSYFVVLAPVSAGAVHNWLAGQVNAIEPLLSVDANDQITLKAAGNGTGFNVGATRKITAGTPTAVVARVDGTAGAIWKDALTAVTGAVTAGNAITGLRVSSSGSGGSPYGDIKVAYIAVYNRAITTAEAQKLMQWASTRFGITIGA